MFKLTCIEAQTLLLSYNSWSPSVEIQFSPWNGGPTLTDFVFTWCSKSGFCLIAQVHAHCTITPPPGGAGNLCQKVCTRLNVSFLVLCLLLTLFSYRTPLIPLVFNYSLVWLDQLDWTSPYPASYIRSVSFWGIWLMPQDIWILTIDSAASIWNILPLKGKYLAFYLDRYFSILSTKCFHRGLEVAPMQSGRPRLVEGRALASQCISSARASSLKSSSLTLLIHF